MGKKFNKTKVIHPLNKVTLIGQKKTRAATIMGVNKKGNPNRTKKNKKSKVLE